MYFYILIFRVTIPKMFLFCHFIVNLETCFFIKTGLNNVMPMTNVKEKPKIVKFKAKVRIPFRVQVPRAIVEAEGIEDWLQKEVYVIISNIPPEKILRPELIEIPKEVLS